MLQKNQEKSNLQKRGCLIYKFNKLQTASSKGNNQQITTKYVKPSIVSFANTALTYHHTSLNLAPNFDPMQRKIPFMEIITATESVALNSKYHDKEAAADPLRQNICCVLDINRNMKIKNNLPKEQQKNTKRNTGKQ